MNSSNCVFIYVPEFSQVTKILIPRAWKILIVSFALYCRMMEWGLLPPGVAKKVHDKKQTRNHQQKLRSPSKVVSVEKTTDVSVKTVKKTSTQTIVKTASKKRKGCDLESDEYDDDDFVLSNIKNKKRKVSA